MATQRKTIKALQAQCRATMVLLPYVIALGLPDEAALAAFGQSMNILNHLPDPNLYLAEINDRFEQSHARRQKTPEERRRYWREYQRVYRARKQLRALEGLAKLTDEEKRALKLIP